MYPMLPVSLECSCTKKSERLSICISGLPLFMITIFLVDFGTVLTVLFYWIKHSIGFSSCFYDCPVLSVRCLIGQYYTQLYNYGVIPTEERYLKFHIKACKHAYILLSATRDLVSPDYYELVIGGYSICRHNAESIDRKWSRICHVNI
jgi:hypothetical protein